MVMGVAEIEQGIRGLREQRERMEKRLDNMQKVLEKLLEWQKKQD